MLLQLSGIDVLLFYMEELLEKVGTRISAADGTIIMGVVQVRTLQMEPPRRADYIICMSI